MAKVIFDEVTKQFNDEIIAVNQLDLDIQDSEFLVLVGPSGCGKSTALRCLAGLEDITSGRIYIGDRDVTYLDPKDRDIAMVFQSYALYPHMSVRDNMGFSLKLKHISGSDINQRVERAAEILGLETMLDRKPRELSGGQRQRVALGRAIVREPQAFLMDEPLSNLDAKLRVQTRAEIIELQRRLGVTTVYVTHDQVEAMTMGDRIAVLNYGVLQQLDTPKNLYDNPHNQFVATFIGSPAMNVFPGTVANGNGPLRLKTDQFELDLPDELASRLRNHPEQQVNFGIRPEDLEVVEFAEHVDEDNTIQLPVRFVEPLGSETLLHLDGPEGETIVAKVDPRARVDPGETVKLAVTTDHLHAFNRETEQTIA